LTEDAWTGTGRGGTHAFGLAAAVELSRALNRLPRRLVLVGIEAGGLEHGEPLSAPVSAAVQPATEAIIGLLSQAGAVPSGTHRGADRTGAVQGVDH
jgi:hydrogenase maturation protease